MSEILGTVRASSWSGLFDCGLRWYYQNIVGLRTPASGRTILGTALHKATAVYDAPRLLGASPNLTEARDALVQTLQKPDEAVAWDDDFKPSQAESIGLDLTTNYAEKIASTHAYRAIELKCEALDIGTEHGTIRVTGTIDRIRVASDMTEGISDIKSGGTAVSADGTAVTKGHQMQTGVYKLMAEHELGRALEAPDEIIGLNAAKNARVGVGFIRDSRTPLVGNETSPGLIELAARMLKSGTFPPNPKSFVCSEKYCAGWARCPYHD